MVSALTLAVAAAEQLMLLGEDSREPSVASVRAAATVLRDVAAHEIEAARAS